MPTRRDFLAAAGASAAGAAIIRPALAQPSGAASTLDTARFGAPLRRHYALNPALTYFNHASIGTIPRAVTDAHARYLRQCETNPWLHIWGGAWDDQAETARARAAAFLGARPDELAILRSTTDAMNILAQGLPLGPGDEVLFSTLNHVGASAGFEHHAARRGYTVRRFKFPHQDAPSLTPDDVVRLHLDQIREGTRLLVLPHVDNMVGLRHPVKRIITGARERGVEYIAIDGAQSAGMIPFDVRALEADFFATSAHKWLQTPKGVGLLYVRQDHIDDVRPPIVTWGQSRWKGTARALEDYGTRDLPKILAIGDAIRFQQSLDPAAAFKHRMTLRARCQRLAASESGLVWRSPRDPDLISPIVAIEPRGRRSGDVFRRLFQNSGYVFRAFEEPGFNAMRLSFNAANTTDEIDAFFQDLAG